MTHPTPSEVRYARARDGLRIAYSTAGAGPPLLFVRGLNSHARRSWQDSWRRPYLFALAHSFTVVAFDARGNGLSDPVEEIDLEALVEDVRAVADDLGLDRHTVYGQGFGSPIAIAYTALERRRVEQLILYCAYARGSDLYIPDFFLTAMRENPQAATMIMGHSTYPDATRLPPKLLSTAGLETTPETAVLYFELARTVDVSDLVGTVDAPTLVLQPKDNRVVPLAPGEEVAASIPGARLVRISSRSYNPWAEEAFETTLIAIADFVGRAIPLMPTPRPMAILVTDLVGSTEMTHRLGDERARDLLHAHDSIVRDARRAHGGVEVKHTGDGVMARFDDAARAVACAVSIQQALAERNRSTPDEPVDVRIGIAYGEVVEERGDLFGTTVALAVRIMDAAGAGQVLVADSVGAAVEEQVDLGPGASLALKGFPEPVGVHEVLWARA